MKIKHFHIFKAEAALNKPIADATHQLTEISFIVLRIETASGVVGESYLLSFQYSPRAIVGALRDVGDMLIGRDVYDMAGSFEHINQLSEYFGTELTQRRRVREDGLRVVNLFCTGRRT